MINDITVSITSHGHGPMVVSLCKNLLSIPEIDKIILTLNIPEVLTLPNHEKLLIINNLCPKGFAANQNAAFKFCETKFFVVLNPDVSLDSNVFEHLKQCMRKSDAKLVAPLVKSVNGMLEDSIRHFPTVKNLLMKFMGHDISLYPQLQPAEYFYPDWVAGMFMLFNSTAFASVNGFDEHFFLYYEDVDICVRFWKKGYRIAACMKTSIVHDAQRDSRKKFRYMTWHLKSLFRYLFKHIGRLPNTIN